MVRLHPQQAAHLNYHLVGLVSVLFLVRFAHHLVHLVFRVVRGLVNEGQHLLSRLLADALDPGDVIHAVPGQHLAPEVDWRVTVGNVVGLALDVVVVEPRHHIQILINGADNAVLAAVSGLVLVDAQQVVCLAVIRRHDLVGLDHEVTDSLGVDRLVGFIPVPLVGERLGYVKAEVFLARQEADHTVQANVQILARGLKHRLHIV